MKYSFMSFSCPELSLKDLLQTAKKHGYDAVEPRVASQHGHGIEYTLDRAGRAEVRRVATDVGLPLCCLATSCRYADPATCATHVEDTHRYVDLAADVGAPRLRVFGGAIPENVSREAAVDAVAAALQAVADHAAERGVVVCMETHDHWCNPADVATVMQRVNHPAIQVNWDIMHPVRVAHADMREAFNTLKPWIRHVHFHDGRTTDGKLNLVPIGTGEIDHQTAVKLLQENGYDGCLSGEWIRWDEPCDTYLPRELATMRRYETA